MIPAHSIHRVSSPFRPKHIAIFGASGAGKSTLMRNMIADDIANGLGVTVVDPHGQLVQDVLTNHIKKERVLCTGSGTSLICTIFDML